MTEPGWNSVILCTIRLLWCLSSWMKGKWSLRVLYQSLKLNLRKEELIVWRLEQNDVCMFIFLCEKFCSPFEASDCFIFFLYLFFYGDEFGYHIECLQGDFSYMFIYWSSRQSCNTSIIRNLKTGVRKKQNNKCSKKTRTFLTPWYAHIRVWGGKKCSSFGKLGVLCFLVTPVLWFALLLYYRKI